MSQSGWTSGPGRRAPTSAHSEATSRKGSLTRGELPFTIQGDGGAQPSFKIRGSYLFCREKPSEVVARKAVHRILRVGTGAGELARASAKSASSMDQGIARPQSGGEEGCSWTRTFVRARSSRYFGAVSKYLWIFARWPLKVHYESAATVNTILSQPHGAPLDI